VTNDWRGTRKREWMERAQKAERENATLSAKFAAVPEYTHYYAEAWRQMFDVDDVPLSFEDWYASRKVPA